VAPLQTIEEFLTATSALLELFRADTPLTEIQDRLIASKIASISAEFDNWRTRRDMQPTSPRPPRFAIRTIASSFTTECMPIGN
jgi:hypothetical protein